MYNMAQWRILLVIPLIIGLVLLFAACQSATQAETPPVSEASPDQPARRIISQLPALTEIVFALGLQDRLVGVTDFCRYPPEALALPKIGGMINPNKEAVLALKPDLILIQENMPDLIRAYHALGLKTLAVKADSRQSALDAIQLVGDATGVPQKATRLRSAIAEKLEDVRRRAAARPSVTAMVVVGHGQGTLRDIWLAGAGSFLDELLELAGGRNIVGGQALAYPKISLEDIAQSSPQAILVHVDHELSDAEKAVERALWDPLATVEAVRNRRVCIVDGDWAFLPGPRMPKIAEAFFACLHSPPPGASSADAP